MGWPPAVACPRTWPDRRLGRRPCGQLQAEYDQDPATPSRYVCGWCKTIWTPRDVSALIKARQHLTVLPKTTPSRQASLPGFEEET